MIGCKVFIFHGAGGNPDENWIPWLKGELEKQGNLVIVPQFPASDGQNLQNWLGVMNENLTTLDENSILIGHSVGATFILSLLEKVTKPVKGAILVSGFTGKLNLPQFDPINQTFAEKEFDWEKIKQNGGKFAIIHGDSDPYVPLEKAQFIAQKLGVDVTIIPNGGHLNEKAGFVQFPLLLETAMQLVRR